MAVRLHSVRVIPVLHPVETSFFHADYTLSRKVTRPPEREHQPSMPPRTLGTEKARGEMALEDPLVEMPEGKFDYDLTTYIYALCDDRSSLIYTTNAVLNDFQNDGVVYLELRTTPRAMSSAGLSSDGYVATILGCIADHNAKSVSMKANLILSIDRRHDLRTALDIVELAKKYRTKGVVGVDLCGDPSVGNVSLFGPAFAQARLYDLPITIHFAEISSVSKSELLTILSFQPSRLGHVIHVPEDIKEEIARQKIGLELCLSCNVHAKMITGSYGDHHFRFWRGEGCPIALSTDDVGVFGSPLSNEYALVARHFGLGRDEIIALAKEPVEAIFGGEDEKERLRAMAWDSW